MNSVRQLGNQGLCVSALGLGCMGMSHAYGESDDRESKQALDYAVNHGITMLDTAEFYGPYTNEKLLGHWLSQSNVQREDIVLATKFGFDNLQVRASGLDSRPEHIRRVVDECLQRLGTDYIDIFYQHRVDPDVPVEEVAGTVGDLVKQGKVKYFGMSEASCSNIKRAHQEYSVSVLQSEYSIWERDIEQDVLPLLRELNIGLVPFSPLGRGFFTAQAKSAEQYGHQDFRAWGDPRLQGANYQHNLRLLAAIKEIGLQLNASPAQVSLAWLLHQGNDIVPIPGSRKIAHIEDNLGAISLNLSDAQLALLNGLTAELGVAGARYTDDFLKYTDRA